MENNEQNGAPLGDANNEENINPDGEIKIEPKGKFFKWLDNFWYHYKWHTLIGAFLVLVAVVCTVQLCSRKKYDVNILYAGNAPIHGASEDGDTPPYQKLVGALEALVPDLDGDGRTAVSLNAKLILSPEEIEEYEKEEGAGSTSITLTLEDINALSDIFMTDAYFVCFLSPYVYDVYCAPTEGTRRFEKLDEYLSESSTAQFYDSNRDAVKLSSTRLWLESASIRETLPPDTLIVLCKPTAFANRNEKAAFEDAEEVIREFLS